MYQSFYEHVFDSPGKYLAVEWLGLQVDEPLTFKKLPSCFPLYHFIFPPARYEIPTAPHSHQQMELSFKF